MKPLKLSGVQGSDGVRHAWSFADSMGVDRSHSKVVGVSFEQPGHWVFTDLNGVIVALGPVLSSNLTPMKIYIETREQKERLKRGTKHIQQVTTCRKWFWIDTINPILTDTDSGVLQESIPDIDIKSHKPGVL